MDYDKFNAYCPELVEQLTLQAPPGYSSVTVVQILRADRAAFMYMAERLTTLKRDARNNSPLEDMLGNIFSHSSVSFHVLPLPRNPNLDRKKTDHPARKRDRPASRDRSNSPALPAGSHKARRASRGKGSKGKGTKGKGPRVPAGLIGKALETRDGKRLCWAFNLAGCNEAEPGQSCRRGLHLCAEVGCQKPHSLREHQ